jgi:hypothetical protein
MGLNFLIFLIAFTSVLGFAIAHRIRPLSTSSLRQAVGALLDWAGLFTLFMAANLVLGALFIFLVRAFTPRFVSLYELEDVLLLILSAAQAFVFQQWCRNACISR